MEGRLGVENSGIETRNEKKYEKWGKKKWFRSRRKKGCFGKNQCVRNHSNIETGGEKSGEKPEKKVSPLVESRTGWGLMKGRRKRKKGKKKGQ